MSTALADTGDMSSATDPSPHWPLASLLQITQDEILWTARLSPFKRGDDLDEAETEALSAAIASVLDGAIEHYERVVALPIPDKLPLALQVHRRAGEPCPRCSTTIEAVHYEDYIMCYCPAEQTGGKVLKDRRLSRLLK